MSTFKGIQDLPLSDKELHKSIMSGDVPGFIDLSEYADSSNLQFDGNDIVDTLVLNDVLQSIDSLPEDTKTILLAILEATYDGDLSCIAMAMLDMEICALDYEPLISEDEETEDRTDRLVAIGYTKTRYGFVRV